MVVRFIPPKQNVSKGLLSSDDPLTPNSLLMPSTLDLPVQREDEQPNLMPNQNTTTNVKCKLKWMAWILRLSNYGKKAKHG